MAARRSSPCIALPVLAALLGAVAAGCSGGESGGPTRLSPADLVRFAERYHGERVDTRGIVHRFDDPEHYWIEGPEGDRVAIRPPESVRERVGERVRVVGRFTYDREQGRAIRPETTEVVD